MSQRADPPAHSSKSRLHLVSRYIPVFGAIALFLAALEFLFPKPVPFMRIGLANIPILLALDLFPFSGLMLLVCIKVLGQGLVNGTLASYVFVFSLAGSFSSAVVMYALKKILKTRITLLGTSVAGALVSNTIQSLLSIFLIFGPEARVIVPYFLGIGTAGSIIVGIISEQFSVKSAWYAVVASQCRGS